MKLKIIIILPVFDDDTGEIKAPPPPNVKTLKLIKICVH